jgi:hypothetical protein
MQIFPGQLILQIQFRKYLGNISSMSEKKYKLNNATRKKKIDCRESYDLCQQ